MEAPREQASTLSIRITAALKARLVLLVPKIAKFTVEAIPNTSKIMITPAMADMATVEADLMVASEN